MIDLQGEEAAKKSLSMSVPAEDVENACRALIAHPMHCHNKKVPSLADVKSYLEKGFLVASMVNLRRLNGQEGYVGHCVLIYDVDEKSVFFHDPGPPAVEARQETHGDFVAAATAPKETNWWITAYKL
jgi:hypothetical protein